MRYLSLMIKPSSSKCNLQCRYCFYNDLSNKRIEKDHGFMTKETMISLVHQALDLAREVHFGFQGGEPTLIGLDFFQDFIKEVNSYRTTQKVSYLLQTNGTTLDESWLSFLKDNDFLVGISLDGYPDNHDYFRNNSFPRVMKTIELLKENDIPFNILTVLTKKLSKDPEKLFNFYLENKLDDVQLIPCLDNIDQNNPSRLEPRDFYEFYSAFFMLWQKEYHKGHYLNINYFDNIIPLFVGIQPYQCGYLGKCSRQLVVESDGSIYPCDFYCLDEYYLGNIHKDKLEELINCLKETSFLHEKKELSNLCADCRYFHICFGQCKKLSSCYYNKDYCALKHFMEDNEEAIKKIAKEMIGG